MVSQQYKENLINLDFINKLNIWCFLIHYTTRLWCQDEITTNLAFIHIFN